MTLSAAKPHGRAMWARKASIYDYDGDTGKRNSETETESYAWTIYQTLRDSLRGTAYSRSDVSLVHVENLAIARLWAGIYRLADKVSNNQLPHTSDDKLEEHARVLLVPIRGGESRADIRAACAARWLGLCGGPTQQVVTDTAAAILGPYYVTTWRERSEVLTVPPPNTYWYGINPGPIDWSLNPALPLGTWSSDRCRIVFQVASPGASDLSAFLDRVNTQLPQWAARALPSWVTFAWSVNSEDGFVLDGPGIVGDPVPDELDFGGLGP